MVVLLEETGVNLVRLHGDLHKELRALAAIADVDLTSQGERPADA